MAVLICTTVLLWLEFEFAFGRHVWGNWATFWFDKRSNGDLAQALVAGVAVLGATSIAIASFFVQQWSAMLPGVPARKIVPRAILVELAVMLLAIGSAWLAIGTSESLEGLAANAAGLAVLLSLMAVPLAGAAVLELVQGKPILRLANEVVAEIDAKTATTFAIEPRDLEHIYQIATASPYRRIIDMMLGALKSGKRRLAFILLEQTMRRHATCFNTQDDLGPTRVVQAYRRFFAEVVHGADALGYPEFGDHFAGTPWMIYARQLRCDTHHKLRPPFRQLGPDNLWLAKDAEPHRRVYSYTNSMLAAFRDVIDARCPGEHELPWFNDLQSMPNGVQLNAEWHVIQSEYIAHLKGLGELALDHGGHSAAAVIASRMLDMVHTEFGQARMGPKQFRAFANEAASASNGLVTRIAREAPSASHYVPMDWSWLLENHTLHDSPASPVIWSSYTNLLLSLGAADRYPWDAWHTLRTNLLRALAIDSDLAADVVHAGMNTLELALQNAVFNADHGKEIREPVERIIDIASAVQKWAAVDRHRDAVGRVDPLLHKIRGLCRKHELWNTSWDWPGRPDQVKRELLASSPPTKGKGRRIVARPGPK